MIHIDKNIGVSGLRVYWVRSACGKYHWCKKAIAFFCNFNMPYEEIINLSPFDPKFIDNYVEGKGKTREEAFANMEKQEEEFANSIWENDRTNNDFLDSSMKDVSHRYP